MKNQAVLIFLFLLGITSGCRTPGTRLPQIISTDDQSEVKAIRAVLQQQVQEWNRGDIPAFMKTYLQADSLRFSSGGTIQRGWQATLDRYLLKYPDREAMGQLRFEDLEILVLSREWAEAFGRYRLRRGGDYSDATGLFTLLLRNTPDGWQILHDHTSTGE